MSTLEQYRQFIARKVKLTAQAGFDICAADVNPILKPHQSDVVVWGVRGGRRAIFGAFGLGKTIMEMEIIRLVLWQMLKAGTAKNGGRGLIVLPLGARQEFTRDARMLATGDSPYITDAQRAALVTWRATGERYTRDGVRQFNSRDPLMPVFVRSSHEVQGPGLYITNYESVRDGKLNPRLFDVVDLDEASCLRGFGGSKTFREFMNIFEGSGIYRFVATATPSPNEFIELLAYAAFLDIMDIGQAKTRFFKRNSEKADQLTIHPHKQREFWLWVSTWAIFIQRPSDLGYSDEGYDMPPLDIRWHEVPSNHETARPEKNGQGRLYKDAALKLEDCAGEKRDSLDVRVAKMMEIRAEDPGAHRIIWHDLEDERRAIQKAIPDAVSVWGTQDLDEREKRIVDFSDGKFQELSTKPRIAGSGCNFQRHCHWQIFLGVGYKFNDFIQAIHRLLRFQQKHVVRVDIIYTEAERGVKAELERKWTQHNTLVAEMTKIIREFGLTRSALESEIGRSMSVERQEESGPNWRLIHNDSVEECFDEKSIPSNKIGLLLTSVPFSDQYEYSPNYRDFGHNDGDSDFFEQMDFSTPQWYRALMPGRVLAVHCKDRITPGGINKLGFQTVNAFSDKCRAHFEKHGFAFIARKTICTDVVRENNQTYRLGWSEQCKDGSRMGCGMPEYLLLFRKPQTDRSKGYADVPVVKSKEVYTRSRWQFDANGFMRSSGDRLLTPLDLRGVAYNTIYQMFRKYSKESVYNFEHHVRIAEYLDSKGMLPSTFMLLPPQSWHPDVWSDITRMRTMNSLQSAKGKEMHLCPLQFDIVNRVITQFSNPGDVVGDFFSGLGTVALCAAKLGREGWGVELAEGYWRDSVAYLKSNDAKMATPSMFDLDVELEEEIEVEAEELEEAS